MEAMMCRAGGITTSSLVASASKLSSCTRLRWRGGLLELRLRSPHLLSVVVNAKRNERWRRVLVFSMGDQTPREGVDDSAELELAISQPRSEFQVASVPSWIAVAFGSALLFATAFLPSLPLGPVGFLREGLYLVGSPQLWQSVWYVGVFLHVLEAVVAFYFARRVDPENVGLWFWQTLLVGMFSLSSLLKKHNQTSN